MKKLFVSLTLIITLLSTTVSAQTYTYFNKISTNYPEESINSASIAYVGGVYYMSQQDGGLFYSHDAVSWHFIDGSVGAKVISDKQVKSDALIVFYNGYLVRSYDGANFELLYTFERDTVIHYDRGLYVAFEKSSKPDTPASIYCSFDVHHWVNVLKDVVEDGRFVLQQYPDKFIINSIKTNNGKLCAVIDENLNVFVLPYDETYYDTSKNVYVAMKNEQGKINLYCTNDIRIPFNKVFTPNNNPTIASYYNGSFYVATVKDDAFYDILKSSDMKNWDYADKIYVPIYKFTDENKALCEAFMWHNCALNINGLSIVKTFPDTSTNSSSVILDESETLMVFGSVLSIVTDEKPLNLICIDALNWHQIDETSAFSILTSHSQRGDYVFVDKTEDHTILKPKGNPMQNILTKGVEVRLDGHYIAFDTPPVIINGRTLVPLRAISESLGAIVDYDDSTKLITIKLGEDVITTTVGSDTANIQYFDGANYTQTLDVASQIINDRTMVPLRFIGETFNKKVEWTDDTKTAWLTSK